MASLSGLLYYYTFDGTSPLTNLITGTDLTLVGSGVAPSTTKFKTGSKSIYNSAASNTGNYTAAISGSTAFSGNECTISLWFNPENTNASGRLIRLSNAALGVCAGISLYVSGTNVGISYDISGTQSTFSSTSSDRFGISANTWIHVAITYSMPVAGTTYIGVYLNGTMIQNPTTSTTYSFLGSTLANLYLFGSGTPQPMAGYIDEVMVFNRALSKNEVMNLYNFNYLSAGQTTLFQSVYGSSSAVANTFVASGGISTTGTITTNNNNINAGLGTINAGSLNLTSTAGPTTSGGFNPTMAGTGSVNCGLVYCGAINTSNSNYTVVSAGTKLTQLKSITDNSPSDFTLIGNTLYILTTTGTALKTFDATAFQPINSDFIPNITGNSMDSYGSNLYITYSTSIKIYDSVTGNNTSTINVGYTVGGVFVYNGIIYVGTQGTNVPPVIAYNTNGTQLSGFSTSITYCQIVSITVANNIIYAGDIMYSRVLTFNATTGATINSSFMMGVAPRGIAVSGSTLFVNSSAYNLSTGTLIASSVISATSAGIKVIGTRLYAATYYGGSYFSNIYSLTEFGSINAGTGTVTCSTITSTTNTITTNNNAINAGTGTVTCSTIKSTTNTITTNNNAINTGSGAVTCGAITSGPITTNNNAINAGSGEVTCGAITTNNNNINAGSGALTCGVITSPSIMPPGSIMAYLGTNNPTGWVICDGLPRTDGSDGRYNNLINMGIGSGSTGNYTPPNYQGAFLRGTGNQTYGKVYQGPSLKQLQGDDFTSHNHTATDSGHYHTYGDVNSKLRVESLSMQTNDSARKEYVQTSSFNASIYTFSDNTGSGRAVISVGSTGGTETRPFNYGVNWIIKL